MNIVKFSLGAMTFVLAILLVTACSDRATTPDGAATSEPMGDEIPDDAAIVYAQTRCAAMFACECEYTEFTTVAECESATAAAFSEVLADMGVSATVFHRDCYDALLVWLSSGDCGNVLEANSPHCRLFSGDDIAYSPCGGTVTREFEASTCQPQFQCLADSVCAPSDLVSIERSEGQTCGYPYYCGAGLYCDDDGICSPNLDAGTACDHGQACSDGLYCKGLGGGGVGVCSPVEQIGAPCSEADPGACGGESVGDGGWISNMCAEGYCREREAMVCESAF